MASFLSPLLKGDPASFQLVNRGTGGVLADTLLVAFDSASRRTGLLKHSSLPEGEALIIAPCNSIHTFFMKFAIDVAFVAKDGRILKVRHDILPWRMSISPRAFAVVEFAAHALEGAAGVKPGDLLAVTPRG